VIVVTAAGGPTGTAVVRALWSRGEQVRAMVGTGRPHPELTALSADLLSSRLGRRVTAVDAVPDGPVPPRTDYAAHCRRLMFDHYRAHGFAGSARVLEALVGRPARTFAEHLQRLGAELETVGPAAAGETR
jgi:hypothetical protein